MPRPDPAAESALRLLALLGQWEAASLPVVRRAAGRRGGARMVEEVGEFRRVTARLACGATELALPADPDGAEDALRRLLMGLRETGAVPWLRVIEIVNEVAEHATRR